MRRLFAVLSFCVGIALAVEARSADEPRAVVERAVKALGGEEALASKAGIYLKMKGTIFLPFGEGTQAPFTAEAYARPSGTNRLAMRAELLGQAIDIVQVSSEEKGWRSMNGEVSDLSKEELEGLRQSRHHERVTALVALLKDKGFTLAPLPDAKVNGRPAVVLKVSYQGQPDVTLSFDKETGLPVKSAYRGKDDSGDGKEKLHETVNLNYREVDFAAASEGVLKEAKQGVDGPALLEFVRAQTFAGDRVAKVKELIRKLGDDSFDEREKAVGDLVAMGKVAVPLLREAARSTDLEVSRRAKDCLQKIGEGKKSSAPLVAAVYLLGLRKPPGAAEALLNYLPGAEEEVAREARAALFAIGQAKGEPDAALVKALEDKDPAKKAAAEAALGKDGGAYARQPGRRLAIPGLKLPMKSITYQDGKKIEEHEVVEVQFFNDFEDKLFAKP